jgi:ABC-type transporter Mla subunit MlaD
MATVGMIGVLGVLALVYIGFRSPDSIPGRSYYNVKAHFTAADNLTGHYQVRDGGKLVGQVLNPRVENGQAVVDLQLDPSVKPLKSDTRLEVRPRSPVGVRYVDIKPGTSGTPIPDHGEIPASQTSSTVQLDTVLGTFDQPTRKNAQRFFRELGAGFAGRGDDLNEAIGGAPAMLSAAGGRPAGAAGTLQSTSGWLSAIADRKDGVRNFISGSGTLADSADPVRQQIADGFAPEAKALQPFTQERTAVHSILDKAPGALSTVSALLPAVSGLVDQVRGFARDIRPGLQAGPVAFTQTSALLRESRPGLRAANATLKDAGRAVKPTLALLSTIRPALPNIDSTLANATPILVNLGAYGCDLTLFGARWASMMGYGNQDGAVLRINLAFGPDSLYGQTRKLSGSHPANPYPKPCQAGTEKVGG